MLFNLISVEIKTNKAIKDSAYLHSALSKQFPYLKSTDIDMLLSICQFKKFKNKEIIFQVGSTTRRAAFILSGVARGYFINKDGVEKNVMLRVEHNFMGVPEWLFGDIPTKYTYEAILECELLVFNLIDIEELAKKNAAIFDLYVNGLKDTILIMIYRIETMIDLSPEERYNDLLEKHPYFFQAAFNKHIANFLGITPVSLSRIIKRKKDNTQR